MDRLFFFEEVISETFVKNEVVIGGMQKRQSDGFDGYFLLKKGGLRSFFADFSRNLKGMAWLGIGSKVLERLQVKLGIPVSHGISVGPGNLKPFRWLDTATTIFSEIIICTCAQSNIDAYIDGVYQYHFLDLDQMGWHADCCQAD